MYNSYGREKKSYLGVKLSRAETDGQTDAAVLDPQRQLISTGIWKQKKRVQPSLIFQRGSLPITFQ